MICAVVDSGTDAAEMFRRFRFLLPVHRGSAPATRSRAIRPPGTRPPPERAARCGATIAPAELPENLSAEVFTVFLIAVSATCFNIFPLRLFLPAKT